MPKQRDDSGQYVETVTLADVLGVFDDVDGPPVVTTADVADATGLSRDSARRKLRELETRGDVTSREAGRPTLYWPTDWPDRDGDERGGADGRERTAALDDVLAAWEPDTQADAETARAQTRRAAAWLRDEGGRHTKSEIVDALAGASALGERSWWERAVQPGLRELADAGLVEYRPGYHDYRWTGE